MIDSCGTVHRFASLKCNHVVLSVVSAGGTRHVKRRKRHEDGTYSASESYHSDASLRDALLDGEAAGSEDDEEKDFKISRERDSEGMCRVYIFKLGFNRSSVK